MKILNFSSYLADARNVLQNPFQVMTLRVVDGVVALREFSKIGTIVGTCISSLCALASKDPSTPLKWTVSLGTGWLISKVVAKKFEEYAVEMIDELRKDRLQNSPPFYGFPPSVPSQGFDSADKLMSKEAARAAGLLEV